MTKRCFQVQAEDNVATLLEDAEAESVALLGLSAKATVVLLEPVVLGHKVCTRAIAAGELVIKYGVPIGVATRSIPVGAWIHLHNCASRVDERSNRLEIPHDAGRDIGHD
ncbi:SAF domain-containing protein [Granulicella pectinivorans]|uniref:SAF domain-containing protein n=1 Tax=Granulicella pectinivorans TaxID=474950 RepID=A0A1I6L4B4_9BACT|nr:UxaA family hydrolase [Granulicella pectinivorans]SFR98311.1 SAF domain-containing protein [Granulicella pectinivorans]